MTETPGWQGDVALIFLSLIVQGIPFLFFGAIFSAVLNGLSPFDRAVRWWPKSGVKAALCSLLLACCFPACDCAVIPMMKRLVQRGIPVSAGITYVMAAPVLNPLCLFSTWLAFRSGAPWKMVAYRVAGGVVIALVVGLSARWLTPAQILRGEVLLHLRQKTETPLSNVLKSTFKPGTPGYGWTQGILMVLIDFLPMTTLYVFGSMGSSLVQVFLTPIMVNSSTGFLNRILAMTLGVILSLCSFADAFVVNSFGSWSLGQQLAFLWIGPIFNLRSIFLYHHVFRVSAIMIMGILVISLILLESCLI